MRADAKQPIALAHRRAAIADLSKADHQSVVSANGRDALAFKCTLRDRKERTLVLARDRTSEKPLPYGLQGDTFLFGSDSFDYSLWTIPMLQAWLQ